MIWDFLCPLGSQLGASGKTGGHYLIVVGERTHVTNLRLTLHFLLVLDQLVNHFLPLNFQISNLCAVSLF